MAERLTGLARLQAATSGTKDTEEETSGLTGLARLRAAQQKQQTAQPQQTPRTAQQARESRMAAMDTRDTGVRVAADPAQAEQDLLGYSRRLQELSQKPMAVNGNLSAYAQGAKERYEALERAMNDMVSRVQAASDPSRYREEYTALLGQYQLAAHKYRMAAQQYNTLAGHAQQNAAAYEDTLRRYREVQTALDNYTRANPDEGEKLLAEAKVLDIRADRAIQDAEGYEALHPDYSRMTPEQVGQYQRENVWDPIRQAGEMRARAEQLRGQASQAQSRQEDLEYRDSMAKYLPLMQQPDWGQKSRADAAMMQGGSRYGKLGNYIDSGYRDVDYAIINGSYTDARGNAANDILTEWNSHNGPAMDKSYLTRMTEEERGVYNYLYSTKGKDAANAFLGEITPRLNRKQRQADEDWWRAETAKHPWATSLYSVLASPAKAVSLFGQAIDMAATGNIDQNAAWNQFSYIPSAIRDEASKQAEKWGESGSFLYQTGISMLDFIFQSAITGGFAGGMWEASGGKLAQPSLLIMGTGAAADTVTSLRDQGMDSTRAFTLGIVSGLAEILTENVSLEALLDPDMLADGVIRYVAKNMLAEGSEEAASDLLNWGADALYDLISGQDKSEWKRSVAELEAGGMSRKEAVSNMLTQRVKELGTDFLGGALSGGVMGLGGAAVQYASPYVRYGAASLGSRAQALARDVNLANALTKIENGERVTQYDARRIIESPGAIELLRSEGVLEGEVRNDPAGRQAVMDAVRQYAAQQRAIEAGQMRGTEETEAYGEAEERTAPAGQNLLETGLTAEQIGDTLTASKEGEVSDNGREEAEAARRGADAAAGESAAADGGTEAGRQGSGGDGGRRAGLGRFLQNFQGLRETRSQSHRAAEITDQVRHFRGELTAFSAREAGLDNGTEEKLAAYYPEELWDRELRQTVQDYADRGVRFVPMVGQLGLHGGAYARAFVSGDGKTMWVQVNHDRLSWQQLTAHEELHRELMQSPGLRAEIIRDLRADPEISRNYDAILNRYVNAYVKLGVTDPVEIEDEMLADYRAGFDMLKERLGDRKLRQRVSETIRETERRTLTEAPKRSNLLESTVKEEPIHEQRNTRESREAEKRTVLSDGDAGRDSGTGAGEPSGVLESDTGARRANSRGRREARHRNSGVAGYASIPAQEIGIRNADGEVTVYPESAWSAQLHSIADSVREATGEAVIFTLGDVPTPGDNRMRGALTENGIIIQADHRNISPAKIAAHMAFRAAVSSDRIDIVSIESAVADELINKLGLERARNMLLRYISETQGMEAEAFTLLQDRKKAEIMAGALDAICADAYAGINGFGQAAGKFQRFVRNAVRENSRGVEFSMPLPEIMEGRELGKEKTAGPQRDLRGELLSAFSIPAGERRSIGEIINRYANQAIRQGGLSEAESDELFHTLYEAGEVTVEADDQAAEARAAVRGRRVYVPESIRHEFGDDWNGFRRQAFGQGIYLTADPGDLHVDVNHAELAEMFPGLFDADETDPRTMLESMVKAAELGQESTVGQRYNQQLDGMYYPEEAQRADLRQQMEEALQKYIDRANGYRMSRETNQADIAEWMSDDFRRGLTQDFREHDRQKGKASTEIPYNRSVILSEETVERWLKDYAAKSSPKYAQAYITRMTPDQFLRLTTSTMGRDLIGSQTETLDAERLIESTRQQPLQLRIADGEVVGHEGRHRATALSRAGVQSIPVLIFDSSNKYSKTETPEMVLQGQDFGNSRSYARVTLTDLTPLSYENRDRIIQDYGTQQANERAFEKLGNRQTVKLSLETAPSEKLFFRPTVPGPAERRGDRDYRTTDPRDNRKVSRVRTHAFELGGLYNEVERQMDETQPEKFTYDSISERHSMNEALDRLRADFDGEAERLASSEAWGGSDLDTAMGILHQYRQIGRDTGDYSLFHEWSHIIQRKGTKGGQLVQAFAKYSRTATEAARKASEQMRETAGRLTPAEQARVRRITDGIIGAADEFAADAAREAVGMARGEDTAQPASGGPRDAQRARDAERVIREIYDIFRENRRDHGVPVENWITEAGDRLAQRISARMEPKATRAQTTMQTILDDLVNYASEHALPQTEREAPRTAIERITDYLNNREAYARAWQEAKDVLRAQYADDPEKLEALESFLNATISYNGEGLDRTMYRAILESAEALGITKKDILDLAAAGVGQNAARRIADEFVRRVGTEDQVLLDAVQRHIGNLIRESNIEGRTERLEDEAARELDIKLQDLLRESRATKAEAANRIAGYLINELHIPAVDAAIAANHIAGHYMERIQARADQELEKIFREKGERIKPAQRDRLMDLIHLGGLTSTNVEDAVVDALGLGKLSRAEQRRITETMARFADTLDAIAEDDLEGLRQLIREQAAVRKTKLDRLAEKVLDGTTDAEYLRDLATVQLGLIAADYVPRTAGEKLSTYQVISHLLNARTAMRNLTSNQVFDLVETAANNLSLLPDIIMSKATGQRSVGLQKSWASAQKRRGAIQGAGRNLLEIALDAAPGERNKSKYGTGARRTWSMANSGTVGRILSRAEQILGYELNTTDEFHKGSVYAETLESLARFVERGQMTEEEAAEFAAQEALYRSFQDDTLVGTMLGGLRDVLNTAGIGNTSGKTVRGRPVHDFGLGDLIVKYTQVPGALIHRTIEFSPVGYVKGLYHLAQTVNRAGRGENTLKAQRDAALAFGRATTGSGLIMLFALLAKLGLLRRKEAEEDANAAALLQSQGITGTQLNVTAMGRLLSGKSPEPQKGDVLADINFLEPLDSLMTIATLVTNDKELKGLDLGKFFTNGRVAGKTVEDSLQGIWLALENTSAMQTLSNIYNTVQYHDAESDLPLYMQVPFEIASSSLSGFVPAPVRQLAQATDTVYRDQYRSRNLLDQAAARTANAVPGVRSLLAPKLTPLGESRRYESPTLNAMNALLNPGSINVFDTNEVRDELLRLYEATGSGTVLPQRNPPYEAKLNGETYTLTPDERTQWQAFRGGQITGLMRQMLASDWYAGLSDVDKSENANWIRNYANFLAAKAFAESRGTEYSSAAYDKAYQATTQAGIDTAVYLQYKGMTNGLEADKEAGGKSISGSKKAKVLDAINSLPLTNAQKDYLYRDNGYAESTIDEAPWRVGSGSARNTGSQTLQLPTVQPKRQNPLTQMMLPTGK